MQDQSRPLREHLRELRKRLLIVVIFALIGAAVCVIYFRPLIDFLVLPASGYLSGTGGPVFTEVTEMVGVTVKVALLGGMVLAAPVMVYQVMMFVAPGLTNRERRYVIALIPGALISFVLGITFAYYLILPPMLKFLLTFGQDIAIPMIRIGAYINLVVTMLFWMGLVFETPLVMYLLALLGIVNARVLGRFRRYWVIIAFILAAIITPTFDPFNQALVAVPLLVLYELGVLLARLAGRKRTKSEAIVPFSEPD